jgi:hypothetical protein
MSRDRQSPATGFTLMELAVALLIFLSGVTALLQLMALEINTNTRNRDIILATSLAQGKADDLLRYTFENSVLDIGGNQPDAYLDPRATAGSQPLNCFSDFFSYTGGALTSVGGACGSVASAPAGTYFVRQWQICDNGDCGGSCSGPLACTVNMKKITITVTALNGALGSRYPATTVVVYKANY